MEPLPDYHVPVLLREAVEVLEVKADGTYVDCTFGGGGHAREILSRLGPTGRLFAFDQDADARRNVPADERVVFVPHNFRHLQRFLRLNKVEAADGILADLGVSSFQFDQPERGFSTRADDVALDMRMDQRQEFTARHVIADYTASQLHKLFERYGEVTNAKTLANTLVKARQSAPIVTIRDLKNAVSAIVKGNPNKYFAQVFQALRIEVNDEMGALKEMLEQAAMLLRQNGVLAVITFHSIEDRIVKHFFKQGGFDKEDREYDLYGTSKAQRMLEVITRKPITPGEREIEGNPRARSAKLRAARKVNRTTKTN
jgi:16S rRNA (cytosine1402-N4)-methyltransferase